MTEQPLDRRDLKIQAMRERLANLTVEHEDRAADYRVEITLLNSDNEKLRAQVRELQEQLEPYETDATEPVDVEDVPEEVSTSK